MPESKMMWVHAISPIHVGCGFGVGVVDLPILREKATNWPILPGSGLKGVVVARAGASDPDKRENLAQAAFGKPDTRDDKENKDVPANAGALIISDARLVLLPVRSLYGTFAWVTCPLALRRLARDLAQGRHDRWQHPCPCPGANPSRGEQHFATPRWRAGQGVPRRSRPHRGR